MGAPFLGGGEGGGGGVFLCEGWVRKLISTTARGIPGAHDAEPRKDYIPIATCIAHDLPSAGATALPAYHEVSAMPV